VVVGRVADKPASTPQEGLLPVVGNWEKVTPLQISEQSVKFVLPAEAPMGVFAFRVLQGAQGSNLVTVNAPDPWWLQGDRGETASPGAGCACWASH